MDNKPNLNQKINIKGALAKYGISGIEVACNASFKTYIHYWHMCYGFLPFYYGIWKTGRNHKIYMIR